MPSLGMHAASGTESSMGDFTPSILKPLLTYFTLAIFLSIDSLESSQV